MTGRRAFTIFLATAATIVAVLMLLLIPVSITLGRYANVVGEVIVLVACVGYVARVMRADRRRRREAEAELPPELRPARRVPRRPITFQARETLFAFLVWFVLIIGFNALVVGLGPLPNVGIAVFAAFMLATLTITGRHMMFRLTAEDDSERGAVPPGPRVQ
jgi:membrane protein implicated in regulation of membrane protease activity